MRRPEPYRRATGTRWRGLGALACVASGVLVASSPLAAQHVVEGRIVGTADGMPIEDVTVRAVGEDVIIGTDSTGYFRFELPADRPGVAIAVEVIGYRAFERTWILPLEEPIRIGLQREAVELDGIDVAVDAPRMSVPEILEFRVRSLPGGIPRSAGAAELRAFGNQKSEIWEFLPDMNVIPGTGCDSCFMASGRVEPEQFILDDREVSFDEFRSHTVGELCRLDVLTFPVGGEPVERGLIIGYTCGFLREVAFGRRTLPILTPNLWDWNQ